MSQRKCKYGFVILHYLAYEMTVKCVDGLMDRFGDNNIQIVIVDNASGNGSGQQLKNLYEGKDVVTVLFNQKNEGFARGNNAGYKYIVENYAAEFIIVMNNDVLIEQDDFLHLIDSVYLKERFAVLGPDIYCPAKDEHQNPAHSKGFSINEVKALYERINRYSQHPAYHYYKHATLGKIKRKIQGEPKTEESAIWTKPAINVVLHGACYVFSPDFVSKRKNCFNPKTFLYLEEDILHYECMRAGLRMAYNPDLKIKHLEDVSTDASIKSGYKKFRMKNEEMKKSIKVLLELMEEG